MLWDTAPGIAFPRTAMLRPAPTGALSTIFGPRSHDRLVIRVVGHLEPDP